MAVVRKNKKLGRLFELRIFPLGFHGSVARVAKAKDAVSKAWEAVQARHGTDDGEANRKAWKAYQRAVIKLVREEKYALYSSPHVRRCIDHAVLCGDKRFFTDLGGVLPSGVGLDKRIERQLPLVRKADQLRRKGRTWVEITNLIDPEYERRLEPQTIRILVQRYRRLHLV